MVVVSRSECMDWFDGDWMDRVVFIPSKKYQKVYTLSQ